MNYKDKYPLVRCKRCEMEKPEHFFSRMEDLAQKMKIERINVCDFCVDSPSENMFDSYGSRTGPTEYV